MRTSLNQVVISMDIATQIEPTSNWCNNRTGWWLRASKEHLCLFEDLSGKLTKTITKRKHTFTDSLFEKILFSRYCLSKCKWLVKIGYNNAKFCAQKTNKEVRVNSCSKFPSILRQGNIHYSSSSCFNSSINPLKWFYSPFILENWKY